MAEKKTPECQLRASRNWQLKNKEVSNYIKNKSSCKSFIRNKATYEDLQEIKELVDQKIKELAE